MVGRRARQDGTSPHSRPTAAIADPHTDPELAVAYLKAGMASLDDPDERATGLLALRTVAEAHCGLGAVATEAGIGLESLYCSLSPKGNLHRP